MKTLPFLLILFWIIVIMFPDLLSYLLWGFFIFIWFNILFLGLFFKKPTNDNYVKFWKYKIFR